MDITIIGNGPSGCDAACEAVEKGANSISLIYRTDRWFLVRKAKFLFYEYTTNIILNRFLFLLVKNLPLFVIYPFVCTLTYIMFYMKGVSKDKIGLPKILINRFNVNVNDRIYEHIESGKINYIRGDVSSIENNNIQVNIMDNNKELTNKTINIKTDYILVCTGYNQNIRFLKMNNIPRLYKNIIHPKYPNCGFIGLVASYNWGQPSDLQARWFIDYISNPKKSEGILIEDMNKYIIEFEKSQKRVDADFHDLAYTVYDYCDDIAKDINIKHSFFSKCKPSYWFGKTPHDHWANKYKIDIPFKNNE